MTSNFNLNMWPILEWMNGHMDRNFSMRFIDPVPVPVVVLMLQDKHWQCERRVTFTHLSNSAVSDLNRAVEAMLQDWAARVDSGELRSLISGGTLRDAVQTDIDTTEGGRLLDGLVNTWVPSPDGTMVEVTPHRKSAEQESTDTGELTPDQIEVIHRTVCQNIRDEMNESSPVHCIPTRYLHMLLDVVDAAVSMMQDAPNPISERN